MTNIKESYTIASGQFTIGLASTPLASSGPLTAGRQSLVLDMATIGLPTDIQIGGKVKLNAAGVAAGVVMLWVYAPYNDVPAYPDTLDGTDKDLAFTNADTRNASAFLLHSCPTPATNGFVVPFAPRSVLQAINLAGGAAWSRVPQKLGIWVVHNTSAALDNTAANHGLFWKAIFETDG